MHEPILWSDKTSKKDQIFIYTSLIVLIGGLITFLFAGYEFNIVRFAKSKQFVLSIALILLSIWLSYNFKRMGKAKVEIIPNILRTYDDKGNLRETFKLRDIKRLFIVRTMVETSRRRSTSSQAQLFIVLKDEDIDKTRLYVENYFDPENKPKLDKVYLTLFQNQTKLHDFLRDRQGFSYTLREYKAKHVIREIYEIKP